MSKEIASLWKSLSSTRRLILIAGPCVIESERLCLRVAESLRQTCQRFRVTYIFKASFDKANRTSGASFRGPGLEAGLPARRLPKHENQRYGRKGIHPG